MSTLTSKLTAAEFAQQYPEDIKPHYELLDGVATQKAMPTKLHGLTQKLIMQMLDQLGYGFLRPGMTLMISEYWQPVPDVVAEWKTQPVHTRLRLFRGGRVLSPKDAFTDVMENAPGLCGMGHRGHPGG